MTPLEVAPARSVLLLIDVQERLAAAMAADARMRLERNVSILIELARRVAIPVILTEQYPKGLGHTTGAVEQALAAGPLTLYRYDKMEFSCVRARGFASVADNLAARDSWLVAGMETHVCVYQSVRDLLARRANVHVIADAVLSRSEENRAIGLDLCRQAGAMVSSTETAVFDALGGAGSDTFRALSRLVK